MIHRLLRILDLGLAESRRISTWLEAASLEDFVQSDDYSLYRDAAADCKKYAEYGVGLSTIWMTRNFTCSVRAVETDPVWSKQVERLVPASQIVFTNVGRISSKGKPKGIPPRWKVRRYLNAPFAGRYKPDFVYVDGRYRVAAFITTLIRSKPGTRIIIDDYSSRARYHAVERLLRPAATNKRQALFIRPDTINLEQAENMLAQHLDDKF